MQAMDNNPRAVKEKIVIQCVGAETLLYDERRHIAFCLNAIAGAVWRLSDGTRTIAEIASAAGEEQGRELGEEMTRLALEMLRGNGLMEAAAIEEECAAELSSRPHSGVSRRAMLRMGIGAAALLPVVASIVAPTAAQAYSGCVDCSVAGPRRVRRQSAPAIAPSGDPNP